MFDKTTFGGSALSLRPAGAMDAPFLEQLYRATRPELERVDAEPERVDALATQQYDIMQAGVGAGFPNAMQFVVERTGGRIGAVMVDFGPNEVRLIYLALLPAWHGQGHGRSLLQGLQQAAARTQVPLAVTVWRSNPRARAWYLGLGFAVEESHPAAERLVWYPPARPMIAVP